MRPDLRSQLEERLNGRVCLIGIGNADYSDDGFGVRLAERLQAAGVRDVVVAGNAPERWIGRIAEQAYDSVVFLDAVDFGAAPGTLALMDTEEIATRFPQFSTHKISVGLLAGYVESNGKTKAQLLGVQPESLKSGAGLSAVVEATLTAAFALLQDAVREHVGSAGVGQR